MIESDFKFWGQAMNWWIAKAEEYLSMGDKEGFDRCMNRVELSEMRKMEESGNFLVWGPEIYA